MVTAVHVGSWGASIAMWGEVLDERVVDGCPWAGKDYERVNRGAVVSLDGLVDMLKDWHDVYGFKGGVVMGIKGDEWVGVIINGVEEVREVSSRYGVLVFFY